MTSRWRIYILKRWAETFEADCLYDAKTSAVQLYIKDFKLEMSTELYDMLMNNIEVREMN